jgi:hypothetical protein
MKELGKLGIEKLLRGPDSDLTPAEKPHFPLNTREMGPLFEFQLPN